jgi:hypothetical protein
MTDLIIKIVRFSGPTSSARGTVDTSRKYVQYGSGSETARVEGGDESGATNRAATAENGPWPFPEDPSLFGIEKTAACEIEPADSDGTTRDALDADGHGSRSWGAQLSEARMEDALDADGHGRRFGEV